MSSPDADPPWARRGAGSIGAECRPSYCQRDVTCARSVLDAIVAGRGAIVTPDGFSGFACTADGHTLRQAGGHEELSFEGLGVEGSGEEEALGLVHVLVSEDGPSGRWSRRLRPGW